MTDTAKTDKLGLVHLAVMTHYTTGEGVSTTKELAVAAKAADVAAMCMMDRNLSGALDFAKACKEQKIKPIIGLRLPIESDVTGKVSTIGLIAKDAEGYRSLCRLHYRSLEVPDGAGVSLQDLMAGRAGTILLTGEYDGGYGSFLAQPENAEMMQTMLPQLAAIWKDDFYIEIERPYLVPGQIETQNRLIDYAYDNNLRIVGTTNIRYDTPAHHERWNIIKAADQYRMVSLDRIRAEWAENQDSARHIRNGREMMRLFSDVPEAVFAAAEISGKSSYYPGAQDAALPKWGAEGESEADILMQQARDGMQKLIDNKNNQIQDEKPYWDRLEYELGVIIKMNFPGYFLIVSDFMKWGAENGIPLGPGRGSGAGSMVAWAMGITKIDPLRYGLLFERFLNPDRVSMPDFDIDICVHRRAEIADYIRRKYGSDRVASIITFGELKAKKAFRDTARVLTNGTGGIVRVVDVNQLAKSLIVKPSDDALLSKLVNESDVFKKELFSSKTEVDEFAKYDIHRHNILSDVVCAAEDIQGVYTQTGIHAAGLIISPYPLRDTTPMQRPKPKSDKKAKPKVKTSEQPAPSNADDVDIEDWVGFNLNPDIDAFAPIDIVDDTGRPPIVCGLDMKFAEMSGLIKFDLLGLATVSVIDDALKMIHNDGYDFDIDAIPLDDEKVLENFRNALTSGVFQFESEIMRKTLTQISPTQFSDLGAANALCRPGPMQFIPNFAARKHGTEKFSYYTPIEKTEPILKETYGIMVYQEQVMQIVQACAGFSLAAADIMRRVMGKKQREELEKQKQLFLYGDQSRDIPGALKNGLSLKEAITIFDDIAKFADYGFNKSHSVAYALISYQTMYLKTYFPVQFMVAAMNNELGKTEKLLPLIKECHDLGLDLLPPDINESSMLFAKAGDKAVRYGFSIGKSITDKLSDEFIAEREKGRFTSIEDFYKRSGSAWKINALTSLVNMGAFDELNSNRAYVLAELTAYKKLKPTKKNPNPEIDIPDIAPWQDVAAREFKTCGLYIKHHPIDLVIERVRRSGAQELETVREYMRRKALAELPNRKICVTISSIYEEKTKKGAKYLRVVVGGRHQTEFARMFTPWSDDGEDVFRENKAVLEEAMKSHQPVIINGSFDASSINIHGVAKVNDFMAAVEAMDVYRAEVLCDNYEEAVDMYKSVKAAIERLRDDNSSDGQSFELYMTFGGHSYPVKFEGKYNLRSAEFQHGVGGNFSHIVTIPAEPSAELKQKILSGIANKKLISNTSSVAPLKRFTNRSNVKGISVERFVAPSQDMQVANQDWQGTTQEEDVKIRVVPPNVRRRFPLNTKQADNAEQNDLISDMSP